jgi:hypothetical protein
MSNKRSYHEIYNRGSDLEIEALFIKGWAELKQLLRNNMFVKPIISSKSTRK